MKVDLCVIGQGVSGLVVSIGGNLASPVVQIFPGTSVFKDNMFSLLRFGTGGLE